MNAHALKTVLLEELDGKENGDGVDVPAESKITILVRYGKELVPIGKVRSVRFLDTFVNVVGESEQFFVDPDCDFIVKADAVKRRADARPGFH